jgi:hypothetical protein
VSGQSLLNLVGFSLFAAAGAVVVHGVLAIWEFGRVLKTVRPDLYRPDLHKFGVSCDIPTWWALYSTPHPNPALERPRKRIVKTYKWFGLLLVIWILFMLMQLIFVVLTGPPVYGIDDKRSARRVTRQHNIPDTLQITSYVPVVLR